MVCYSSADEEREAVAHIWLNALFRFGLVWFGMVVHCAYEEEETVERIFALKIYFSFFD